MATAASGKTPGAKSNTADSTGPISRLHPIRLPIAGLMILVLALASCDIANKTDDPEILYLVDYTLVGELTPQQIVDYYDNPLVSLIATNDVRVYRLSYQTQTINGSGVVASGLVMVPRINRPSLLVLNRGTLFRKSEAPSLFDPAVSDNNSAWTYFGPVVSSSGYLIIMPDLLGFGESASLFHPYFVTRSHGRVALDMMKAAEEFFAAEGIERGNRVFVTGYSQGGTTSMALLKANQAESPPPFNITAASIGGGAYDLLDVSRTILSADTLGYAANYAFLVAAYDRTYALNRTMETIFRPPYAGRIFGENLFGGQLGGDEINARLTSSTAGLFQETFLDSFLGDGEQVLKALLGENDVSDFPVSVPLRIYHGDRDEVVPIGSALRSFDRIRQNSPAQVQFVTIPGGTHESSAFEYASQTLNWFFFQ